MPNNLKTKKHNNLIKWLPYIIIAIIIGVVIYFLFFYNPYKEISWGTFYQFLQDHENVKDGKGVLKFINGQYIFDFQYTDGTGTHYFEVVIPNSNTVLNELFSGQGIGSLYYTFGSNWSISSSNGTNIWLSLFINFLPFILILGFGFWFYRKMAKGGGAGGFTMNFGKNKARLLPSSTTFRDVAGYIEEKFELEEIVDFLKFPDRFASMGAKTPKGVLMVGSPGTGKTLLAKACAGEAGVPFFTISGSDFVEMFVGVGASRVRELFKDARKSSPCIIFIDELDAVGRQRGAGLGGSNDEREQTLNQILVEMDGFDQRKGIIIIAATNRPDVLDPALLRPGRFDRQIVFHVPNVKEREQILKIHSRNKNISPNVDFSYLAKRTPGFSGAQLENVLNESALLAVRVNKNVITNTEIDEAIDRVIGGPAKKTRIYTAGEKKLVAYHESGHALIGLKLEGADKVQKVTIIPRGLAGGYTLMTPKEEKFLATKKELLSKITGYLAGRATEELIFGEENITTGAQNDIKQATKIAREMVTQLGMSELGLIQFESNQENPFLGKDYTKNSNFSSKIAFEIDKAVKNIIDKCYVNAIKIIKKHRKLLDLLATALLELEIITAEEIEYINKNLKLPPSFQKAKKNNKKSKTKDTKKSDTIEPDIIKPDTNKPSDLPPSNET